MTSSRPGAYGNYFGATFYIAGHRDVPVALLWARDKGYWKIASWKVGVDDAGTPAPDPVPEPEVVRIKADPTLVQAAREFLESWLIRKDGDAAFAYLSPKAYGCYDLERSQEEPAPTSREDAGRRLRANFDVSVKSLPRLQSLEAILEAAEPFHSAIRVMDHPFASVFSLSSIPNALADGAECEARASGRTIPDPLPPDYGEGFAMTVRFKTRGGDTPVLRVLWRKENGAWRITSYDVEMP